MPDSAETFVLEAAPIRIGKIRLKVRDLGRVSAFYQSVIGLQRLSGDETGETLGTGGAPLVELASDASLAPRDPRAAGLFHTAFLLPSRSDLARWLVHAAEKGVPLEGASDHIVSEAVYLSDPEGNGIEVYADRPPSRWRGRDGAIRMATEPLDLPALRAEAGDRAWAGFPRDGVIGHVHLQVGDTAAAEAFYGAALGFDVASRYPGASFFGSGGYHHQLAGNVWNSRDAGPRPAGAAGLDEIELVVDGPDRRTAILERAGEPDVPTGRAALRDPWGTRIVLATRR